MRKEIRAKLFEKGLRLPDLAKLINRSTVYLSKALNNKTKLRVDEAFKIGDILEFSPEKVKELLS